MGEPEQGRDGSLAPSRKVDPLPAGQVAWRPWSQRDSARALGRPVLLFLYTRRSFWCREMSARCFGDREAAREIEHWTFPVRIDVDRRPDLAERYGMGGWPSVALLSPEGDLLSGSTYMDQDDLLRLVRRVGVTFRDPKRSRDLERQRSYFAEHVARARKGRRQIGLTPDLLRRVVDSVRTSVGRGVTPGPESLTLLAEYGATAKDPAAGAEAAEALGRVVSSPLLGRDGLFFLAPLTRDTVLVDREINLATNAGWLAALSRTGRLTGRAELGAAAEGLGEAMGLGLTSVESGLLTAGWAGFQELTGPDGQRFVLHGDSGDALADTVVYSGWNALAASGFVELYRCTRRSKWLALGRGIQEAIRERLADSTGAIRHCVPEGGPFLLSDQALVARAALDLFDAEGRVEDLGFARGLADQMLYGFASSSGPLRDRSPDVGGAIAPAVDRLLPSANGVAAQVLVRLHAHTGHDDYRARAERVLRTLIGPNVDRAAQQGALGRALLLYLHPAEGADLDKGE